MSENSTVLIVDDDPISRFTVKALLEQEKIYNLEFAENGEQGLTKALDIVPDVMLLDVMMPGIDGFEVCRRLRTHHRLAELPIVMVTTLDDRQSRLRGIEAGADDFMSKPFDQEELCARIRTITRLNRYRRLVETKEQLFNLANYDNLTKLPNRNLLMERLRQSIEHADRSHQSVAVLALDLDGFKTLNDSLGHEVGDKILCEVTERLKNTVSHGATVSRFSADEFVIIFDTNNPVQDVNHMAQALLASIKEQMVIDDYEMVVTACIGISVFPDDGEDAGSLLKHAELALSRAKSAEKNSYQFFTSEMNEAAMERLVLENKLRKVLKQDELRLYYQPQIELNSGRLIGMEALLRWQNPEWGLVSPAKFVPIAEETGLIIDIGEWVLRTACKQNKAWQLAGHPPTRVSVNLSSRQFQIPNLLETIKDALAESELEAKYLELELTESVLLEDSIDKKNSIFSILNELQTMGVKIAIDDFGTGYSSLSYLKRFPVNTLKIDRSFVKDVCYDNDDAAITTAIIAMAHSLRLSIVAEGVEDADQLAFLKKRECEIIQGYYFSPPLSANDMTQKFEKIGTQAIFQ
jgi:diguanylate cyclase (GGDEF)-like protein